jgi:hypothetical protein
LRGGIALSRRVNKGRMAEIVRPLADPAPSRLGPDADGAGSFFHPKRTAPLNEIARPMPRPTAQIAPYFDVLGLELTVDFLLTFGGAELAIPTNPRGRSELERLVGYDRAKALGQNTHLMPKRVPLAKRWLSEVMAWQGLSIAATARKLRISDNTVRRYLKGDRSPSRDDE